MISHEFNTHLHVERVSGSAYLVSGGSKISTLVSGMQVTPNHVLLTKEGASVVVESDGKYFSVDNQCSSCLVPLTEVQQDKMNLLHDAKTLGEREQLQDQIEKGSDPSLLFEEAASGEALSSANGGAVILDYHYAATLAKAGFDTTGLVKDPVFIEEDDGRFDVDSKGGESASLSLDENQLTDFQDGMQTHVSFFIAGGTHPLQANSLHIDANAFHLLEAELQDLQSGGEFLVFSTVFNSENNTPESGSFSLVGSLDGRPVLSVTMTAQAAQGTGLSVTASLSQFAPLDHDNEIGTYVSVNGDSIEINLPLQARDIFGDLMQSPVNLILVTTDSAAAGGERLDAHHEPLDVVYLYEQLTSRTYNASLPPNSRENTFIFEADADKLLPQTLYIDDLETLKNELEMISNNAGERIDSVTVSPSVTLPTGETQLTLTALIQGEPALEIILMAKQGSDGLGMNVEATFNQYQAIRHPLNETEDLSSKYVNLDASGLDIKLPLQVKDQDGSLLVNPQNSAVESPRLLTFSLINDALYVKENGIGPGTGLSDGSQTQTNNNVVSTFQNNKTLTLDPYGEKSGEDFYFSVYAESNSPIKLTNGTPLNAHDHTPEHPYLWTVFLHQSSTPQTAYPKEYLATTNHDTSGVEVFKITLQESGEYSFELLTALNHAQGQGNNTLEFDLQAYTKDASGAVTDLLHIPVVVEDDTPPAHTVISVEVVNTSSQVLVASVDVFDSNIALGLEGADGAALTAIYNGKTWVNVSTTLSTDVLLYSPVPPYMPFGSVNVNPRVGDIGELIFTFHSSIVNASRLLDENIQYQVMDVDGDTVTGSIDLSSLKSDLNTANTFTDGSAETSLFGGKGNDTLIGGLGQDILIGGPGDDVLWGGMSGGSGDGYKDIFGWQAGDFGSATTLSIDTIKDFEVGLDVIDISGALDTSGLFTFEALANTVSVQTLGTDTLIQISDTGGSPIQQIVVEGKTLDDLLGVATAGMTQSDILESILVSGQLVVFDVQRTQFGTQSAETLTATMNGERLIARDGDDTLIAGLGNDILMGGEGDDTYTWALSSIDMQASNTDTVGDFEIGPGSAGDVIDISAILPSNIDSNSELNALLEYIVPEEAEEGLTLHLFPTGTGSTPLQNIVLYDVGLTDLGLSAGATEAQILDQLIQQQAIKLD